MRWLRCHSLHAAPATTDRSRARPSPPDHRPARQSGDSDGGGFGFECGRDRTSHSRSRR